MLLSTHDLATAEALCHRVGILGAVPPLPALGLAFACGFLLSGSALITNDYLVIV